jgi:hypothetical protein
MKARGIWIIEKDGALSMTRWGMSCLKANFSKIGYMGLGQAIIVWAKRSMKANGSEISHMDWAKVMMTGARFSTMGIIKMI